MGDAAVRAGAPRARGQRGDGPRAALRSARSSSCPSAPSTTRARRGRPCTTSSAGCSRRARERRAPNGAVRLLEAGGERAEAEIVGAEVLELMRDGVAAEDIAVLVRGSGTAALFAQVLGTYGIRVAWARGRRWRGPGSAPGCWRARGRRSPAARAEDLLTWLRTPGVHRGRRPLRRILGAGRRGRRRARRLGAAPRGRGSA